MTEYLAYILDEDGQRSKSAAALIIRENTDEEAIAAAKLLVDGYALELWQDTRRVITLQPGKPISRI